MPAYLPPTSLNQLLPYVVLIDDDEDDISSLSIALLAHGIQTYCFASVEDAMNYIRLITDKRLLPALIISDYSMPKLNGEQLLAVVKANKDMCQIPVVLYSTGMTPVLRSYLIEHGALECFAKPWTLVAFAAQVLVFKSMALESSLQ